jgi:hypothetical protein
MYTRHLAKYAKEVFGLEANPAIANFARRGLRRVAGVEWLAISSISSHAELRIPFHDDSYELPVLGTLSGLNTLGNAAFVSTTVPIERLDDCGLPPVGFIKVVVEWHEEATSWRNALISANSPVVGPVTRPRSIFAWTTPRRSVSGVVIENDFATSVTVRPYRGPLRLLDGGT